jgi:hypothetical protein
MTYRSTTKSVIYGGLRPSAQQSKEKVMLQPRSIFVQDLLADKLAQAPQADEDACGLQHLAKNGLGFVALALVSSLPLIVINLLRHPEVGRAVVILVVVDLISLILSAMDQVVSSCVGLARDLNCLVRGGGSVQDIIVTIANGLAVIAASGRGR